MAGRTKDWIGFITRLNWMIELLVDATNIPRQESYFVLFVNDHIICVPFWLFHRDLLENNYGILLGHVDPEISYISQKPFYKNEGGWVTAKATKVNKLIKRVDLPDFTRK